VNNELGQSSAAACYPTSNPRSSQIITLRFHFLDHSHLPIDRKTT
jgi:hypothetical protein